MTTFERKMTTTERFVRFVKHRYVTIISYSGKGGTGKTLGADNLALRFAKEGFNVGLVDIDIEMSSVARTMGFQGELVDRCRKRKLLLPKEHKEYPNLKMFSLSIMPFFEGEDVGECVFWGGEYQREYVFQMVFDVYWGDLDVMIFDLPAGISDAIIALTNIYKKIDYCLVTGQNNYTSTDGISKAITTCKHNNIEILGVIANEDHYICPKCKHKSHPKGKGKVKKISEKYNIEFLGPVPLSEKISKGMGEGHPFVDSTTYDAAFLKAVMGKPRLHKKYKKLQRRK